MRANEIGIQGSSSAETAAPCPQLSHAEMVSASASSFTDRACAADALAARELAEERAAATAFGAVLTGSLARACSAAIISSPPNSEIRGSSVGAERGEAAVDEEESAVAAEEEDEGAEDAAHLPHNHSCLAPAAASSAAAMLVA